MIAVVSSSLQIVFIYVFATIIGQLVNPFGFSSSDYSELLGILNNGFGILGAVLASVFLRGAQERTYKMAAIISNITTIITFSYFIIAVWGMQSKVHVSIATSLVGFTSIPILMISYEFAICQTLP
jgi:hypothetical protein